MDNNQLQEYFDNPSVSCIRRETLQREVLNLDDSYKPLIIHVTYKCPNLGVPRFRKLSH